MFLSLLIQNETQIQVVILFLHSFFKEGNHNCEFSCALSSGYGQETSYSEHEIK
jgi:hypothetical protein